MRFPADHVKSRAQIQYRVSDQSRSLLMLTKVRRSLLPYVPRDKFDTMAMILGVLLAATFLKGLFIYFQEMLVGSVVQLTVNSIRQDCFRSALRLDYQSLNRIGTSSLMSRMTNDIEQMTMAIRVFGVTLVREPLKAGACTALAFYVNWRLTTAGDHRCSHDGADLQSLENACDGHRIARWKAWRESMNASRRRLALRESSSHFRAFGNTASSF